MDAVCQENHVAVFMQPYVPCQPCGHETKMDKRHHRGSLPGRAASRWVSVVCEDHRALECPRALAEERVSSPESVDETLA